MITQMHHQFKDDHTEIIAQREIYNNAELAAWIAELWRTHPPPKDARWLACTEGSEHFVKAAEK